MVVSEVIKESFEKRKIYYLVNQLGGDPLDKRRLEIRLMRVQQILKEIEEYLENNWMISDRVMLEYEEELLWSIDDLFGDKHAKKKIMTNLRKNFDNEMKIRSKNFPSRLTNQYYYNLKISRTSLLRFLVYGYLKLPKNFPALEHWKNFDILYSIIDEIDDLFEDMHIINNNKLLFHIWDGMDQKTLTKSYLKYVQILLAKQQKITKNFASAENFVLLEDWVKQLADEVQEKLVVQLEKYRNLSHHQPLISQYIDIHAAQN